MDATGAWGQVVAMSAWEYAAVFLGIAYLILAARENIWCWACALISTCIYTALFWNESLLMESALNVYYIAMAVYGWWQWRPGQSWSSAQSAGHAKSNLKITKWQSSRHVVVIAAVIMMAVISGALLSRHTTAAWPYIDSFTTWGAVVTTWMVANKILENWIYWFVIDGVSIPLYLDRGLYLTACLFTAYLVIVVLGYFAWLKEYREYADDPPNA
ncbi:MAG: nicotinamide riboside transporter PnuC [Gammaproteobacteria bacterium]